MIKTDNNCPEITQKIPELNMNWQVFHHGHQSPKTTSNTYRFHKPVFDTQLFIVDWQLEGDDPFDVEKIWY